MRGASRHCRDTVNFGGERLCGWREVESSRGGDESPGGHQVIEADGLVSGQSDRNESSPVQTSDENPVGSP
jgi:hypothetical protein